VRYLIEHETLLAFPKPVREHQCELRLAPREEAGQRRLACEISIEPAASLSTHADCFGNLVHRFSLLAPHDRVRVHARTEVETSQANPFDYMPLDPAEERGWLEERLQATPSLHDFVLHRSDAVPDAAVALAGVEPPGYDAGRTLLQNVQAAMAWSATTFRYAPGTTEVHGALAEFAEQRAGVCQDFAHLIVSLVRSWDFAARYVMGYVDAGVLSSDEAPLQATHAWAEVLVPGAGWRGVDATVGLVTNDAYVPVAVGRESRDAAPLRGTFKGDATGSPPQVAVRVSRADQPRPPLEEELLQQQQGQQAQ
jgi:transglutaminase-like putative cysteine protease